MGQPMAFCNKITGSATALHCSLLACMLDQVGCIDLYSVGGLVIVKVLLKFDTLDFSAHDVAL